MQDFELNMPMLEDTIAKLQTFIQETGELKSKLETVNADLADRSWEGVSSEAFQRSSDDWSERFGAYLENMNTLKETLSNVVLPKAQELDRRAIGLAGLVGGAGSGSSERVGLSWSGKDAMCRHCAELCHMYDDYIQRLRQVLNLDGDLCYTSFSFQAQTQRSIRLIQDNQDKLHQLQEAMDQYQEGVEELEQAVQSKLSSIRMPEGWSAELGTALELNIKLNSRTVKLEARKLMNYKGLNAANIRSLMQQKPQELTELEYLALEYVYEQVIDTPEDLQLFLNVCYIPKAATKPNPDSFPKTSAGARAYLQAMEQYNAGDSLYELSPIFKSLADHYIHHVSLPAMTELSVNLDKTLSSQAKHIDTLRRAGILGNILRYGDVSIPLAPDTSAYSGEIITVDALHAGQGHAVTMTVNSYPLEEGETRPIQITQYEFSDWDVFSKNYGSELTTFLDTLSVHLSSSGEKEPGDKNLRAITRQLGLIGGIAMPGTRTAVAALCAIALAFGERNKATAEHTAWTLADYAYAYGLWGQLNLIDSTPHLQYMAIDERQLVKNLTYCRSLATAHAHLLPSFQALFAPRSSEDIQKIHYFVDLCKRIRTTTVEDCPSCLPTPTTAEQAALSQAVEQRWSE